MRIMQQKWFYVPVVIIVVAFFALQACKKEEEIKIPEGAIAIVNGEVITQDELDKELAMAQQQFAEQEQPSDEKLAEIKNNLIESLISRKVLYQESQKKGITIDDAAIDDRLAKIKAQFPKEDDFKAMLDTMKLDEALLKAQLREGMAIQKLAEEEIINKIEVSDQETKEYYDGHQDLFKQPEQVQASHILVKVDDGAEESVKTDARKKIEEVQKKLKEGGDFAALAKEYSDCPSGANGGDLGYFGRGQMVKPFEDAAFAMQPGEISDIVETQFGYHLIKAGDKKPGGTIDYDAIKERLAQYLKQTKTGEEVKKYVEKLKGQSTIEKFVPETEKKESAG
ncbi:MAG TPA: peptidylprolyl isomerase [Syntrophales bacterium]|nr:peptidylprolyl isomerase [Syntrophales bacterium]HPQ43768.1 peptidylprolyl isomerase [Syntrophales bacterium]